MLESQLLQETPTEFLAGLDSLLLKTRVTFVVKLTILRRHIPSSAIAEYELQLSATPKSSYFAQLTHFFYTVAHLQSG